MKEYTVRVFPCGSRHWLLNGKAHCEHGPAVIDSAGFVQYWLNAQRLTKAQWEEQLNLAKEMSIAEIEKILGHKVKVIDK